MHHKFSCILESTVKSNKVFSLKLSEKWTSVKSVKKFLKEIIYKRTSNWFMRNWRYINVIDASTQLSNIKTSEDTLYVYMKKSNNTFATFAKRVLVWKIHSKVTLKGFMKIKSLSNVICVIIQLLNIPTLENTLNASMKISSNINVLFAKRALD
jgi:hypothetical protein